VKSSRWALIAEFYFITYFLSESVPPWLFPASTGRNYQWSSRRSRLPGRHSLQWCNSGSTFTESAPVSRKASWQRSAMPSWEMHLRPATGGLLGARAVQRRNSPMAKVTISLPHRGGVRVVFSRTFLVHVWRKCRGGDCFCRQIYLFHAARWFVLRALYLLVGR